MTEKKRLLSLDILRGITVAGMILVNNSGGKYTFEPLKHAAWNGLTPCDLVFPFFLFIMGISTFISLNKFNFEASSQVVGKILKRTLIILLIGWGISWFSQALNGNFFPYDTLRLTGVMPRIAICYGVVSLIALFINHRHLIILIVGLLIGYSAIILLGNGYANDETNILAIIDRNLIGFSHLYQKISVDPEGVTSTLAAIAHTLIGFCCGSLIIRVKDVDQKVLHLFLVGFILMALGWLLSYSMPFNKRIWSPSFTLMTCGGASSLLAALMYLIDIKKKEKWSKVFLIFGVNPLFLYVASELLAIALSKFKIKHAIYENINLIITNPYWASALYAILFTALLGVAGYVLYKKRIYIKI